MSKSKATKTTLKPINKRPSKVTPVTNEPVKMVTTKKGLTEIKSKTVSKDSRKFVKVFANESIDKFKEIGEQVLKKELKWVYYTTENNVGVHYYLILNTNTI